MAVDIAPSTPGVDVGKECSAYCAMARRWQLPDALCGGTQAMRDDGKTWLPKFDKEPDQLYTTRLSNSFLYEAFKDTIEKLADKPFAKPLTVEGSADLPVEMQPMLEDIDSEGTTIDAFARELMVEGEKRGIVHILVDYPQVPRDQSRGVQLESKIHPYFQMVSAKNVIGWKRGKDAAGRPVLIEVRIRTCSVRTNDDYSEESVTEIRTITTQGWTLHEKTNKSAEYRLVSDGVHGLGFVPLVTIYFKRTGFMTADPPLEGLAFLNHAHYVSSSDQRNCQRAVRAAVMYILGFSPTESAEVSSMGPNIVLRSTNSEAKIGYAEHNGKALEAGTKEILLLEDQMQVLGLEPLMERAAPQTATGRELDAGKTHSAIGTWIRQIEDGLERAFMMAAKWVSVVLPENFEVAIFSDFGIGMARAADLQTLLSMRTSGEISRATFLAEIKRRGVLSDSVDIDEEAERIDAEGPSLEEMQADMQAEEDASEPGGPPPKPTTKAAA